MGKLGRPTVQEELVDCIMKKTDDDTRKKRYFLCLLDDVFKRLSLCAVMYLFFYLFCVVAEVPLYCFVSRLKQLGDQRVSLGSSYKFHKKWLYVSIISSSFGHFYLKSGIL